MFLSPEVLQERWARANALAQAGRFAEAEDVLATLALSFAGNDAFLAMRAMRKTGGGKIINVASRAAFRGETDFADYGASKAALVNLTRSIARGCAKDNIIASCVAPGFIETDMARSELEAHYEDIINQIPLRRVGTVADVANVIAFLASPLADYLNGVTIDINGGSWFH